MEVCLSYLNIVAPVCHLNIGNVNVGHIDIGHVNVGHINIVAPVGHIGGIVGCQVSVDQLKEMRLKSRSLE